MPLYFHSGSGGAERASPLFLPVGLQTGPFPRLRARQPGAGLSLGSGVTAQLLTMNEQSEDCFSDASA